MCPVCYYAKMRYPATDYNICPCCGTEFDNDDEDHTHEQLRTFWIAKGAKWFFREQPPFWNPWRQLAEANVVLPYTAPVTYGDYIDVSQRHQVMYYGAVPVLEMRRGNPVETVHADFHVPLQPETSAAGSIVDDVIGMAA